MGPRLMGIKKVSRAFIGLNPYGSRKTLRNWLTALQLLPATEWCDWSKFCMVQHKTRRNWTTMLKKWNLKLVTRLSASPGTQCLFASFMTQWSPASYYTYDLVEDNLVSVVCARCGKKEPAGDFASKRKSAAKAKSSLDCRNFGNSYRKRGPISQDNTSTAGSRVTPAAIQHDHRSQGRVGETVSLTQII